MNGANKYTIHSRIAMAENAIAELKKENAELRVHLKGALETAINDAKNVIQDSIRIPQDGRDGLPGRDGVDGQSIVGPQGPRGDVLIPNESEAQAALKEARLNNAKRHAIQIARIVDRIEFERTHNLRSFDDHSFGHFHRLLADIQKDIENLS
jgi:hypothetical protein